MGQCLRAKPSRETAASATLPKIGSALEKQRVRVIECIHKLHIVYRSCGQGIDECVSNNERSLAMLIKLKQAYIKSRLKSFQDLVKEIDDAIRLVRVRLSRKKEIIEEAESSVNDLDSVLLRDNVQDLVAGKSEVVEALEKEIGYCKIDNEEAANEVDSAFMNNKIRGNPKRKRYNRKPLLTV